jgi:hypothetical protein
MELQCAEDGTPADNRLRMGTAKKMVEAFISRLVIQFTHSRLLPLEIVVHLGKGSAK